MNVDATVQLSAGGRPVAIRADGQDYVAAGRPALWFSRAPWWEQPDGAPLSAEALERERWVVPSVDRRGRTVTVELEHDRTQGRWSLLAIAT